MYQNYNNPYGGKNSQQKPEKVKLAIQLLYISLAINFFHGLLNFFNSQNTYEIVFAIVIFVLTLGIELTLIYFISKANNTARIIYTILLAVGILFALPALSYLSILDIIFIIGSVGLSIYIVILLFNPTSSRWFRQGGFNY